ncbi:MAG: nuclear transport factor 2 family protein [Bacteroides sp.]|nr:nuclear transport factor 2 family protein [Bacteroides sp.]
MRKITALLILLLFVGVNSFSQKKSGTIFSEHETIDLTRELWQAAVSGDEEKYRSLFADSAYILDNGKTEPITPNAKIGKGLAEWVGTFDNLKISDQKPAFPDAMEYKEEGIWVSDWLLMTGIHKETGIRLNVPIHNMYSFNEEGKIAAMITYFDGSVFEEISDSKTTKGNGKVYINHPYISTVRKAMNAFVAKDVDTWTGFYSPKARFSNLSMKLNESMSLEEYKAMMSNMFFKEDLKFKVEQVGYPDCIYYEKNDMYVVYSWWNMVYKKDGQVNEYPFMLYHTLNDEGLIVSEIIYVSSNHLEKL